MGAGLVSEVADTSLRRAGDLKLPPYGRADVRETWVIDLAGEVVIGGREPGPTGYGAVTLHRVRLDDRPVRHLRQLRSRRAGFLSLPSQSRTRRVDPPRRVSP